LPKGFTSAPFIAQCCTWSLLLNPVEGEKTHEKKRPLDDLGDKKRILQQRTDPPVWVPLKSGGGIFVLLDNILIATPNKKTADFWFNRLFKNCQEFHAVLKSSKEVPPNDDPEEYEEALKEQLQHDGFHTMSPQSSTTFNFYGVDWKHIKEDELKTLLDFDGVTRKFKSRRSLVANCCRQTLVKRNLGKTKGSSRLGSSLFSMFSHRLLHSSSFRLLRCFSHR
jgi:hypothetical protein